MSQVGKISGIVRDIEVNVPECQVDVELNSLEDAYVKIAEDEIAASDAAKQEQDQPAFAQTEEQDFQEYAGTVGTQTFWKKVTTVAMVRIRSFFR